MAKSEYSSHDSERFVAEDHSSRRSPYVRDRARVIHSSGWRRLAAKTQVLSPTAGVDFARNRLTHSLEVAQIGRELANSLGLDEDIVDTACLAHDLGHPPFGHNGERALDTWMRGFGGFEGNAHTLRILTRLETKHFSSSGQSVGLNLTRATLDASCKYPWSLNDAVEKLIEAPADSPKFGFFEDDEPVYTWMREGATPGKKCAEAQTMDLSDDIAYSVHDFEDAIVGGFIDPELLSSRSGHDFLIKQVREWAGNDFSTDQLAGAFDRISRLDSWLVTWDESRQHQAQLKNFTSDLIGRFARSSIERTLASAGSTQIARYSADIVVSQEVLEEIAVLKGIVAAYVMASGRRQPAYQRQRELLTDLLEVLWKTETLHLEAAFELDFTQAKTESAARRVIVDQIASLTDQTAIAWHQRLCLAPLV